MSKGRPGIARPNYSPSPFSFPAIRPRSRSLPALRPGAPCRLRARRPPSLRGHPRGLSLASPRARRPPPPPPHTFPPLAITTLLPARPYSLPGPGSPPTGSAARIFPACRGHLPPPPPPPLLPATRAPAPSSRLPVPKVQQDGKRTQKQSLYMQTEVSLELLSAASRDDVMLL